MPLNANALTTLAAVRELLQIPADETSQDPVTETLINHASTLICNRYQREFAPATDDVTREFVYYGGHVLDLAPYDARSVSAVSIDSDTDSPTVLTADQWRLRPKPARDGVYKYLKLPFHDVAGGGAAIASPYGVDYASSVRDERELTVTGDWGFAAVPSDIELQAKIAVMTWLRQDVQAYARAFNDQGQLQLPDTLPAGVEPIGDAYFRAAIA